MAEKTNTERDVRSGAELCRDIYEKLNFDPSNVVFSPAFAARAKEEYARRNQSESRF
ncbi:MAG: hypothetical protein AAF401_18045 [Pseudomonadota bacterium]